MQSWKAWQLPRYPEASFCNKLVTDAQEQNISYGYRISLSSSSHNAPSTPHTPLLTSWINPATRLQSFSFSFLQPHQNLFKIPLIQLTYSRHIENIFSQLCKRYKISEFRKLRLKSSLPSFLNKIYDNRSIILNLWR